MNSDSLLMLGLGKTQLVLWRIVTILSENVCDAYEGHLRETP
jgi:hypothetical protein